MGKRQSWAQRSGKNSMEQWLSSWILEPSCLTWVPDFAPSVTLYHLAMPRYLHLMRTILPAFSEIPFILGVWAGGTLVNSEEKKAQAIPFLALWRTLCWRPYQSGLGCCLKSHWLGGLGQVSHLISLGLNFCSMRIVSVYLGALLWGLKKNMHVKGLASRKHPMNVNTGVIVPSFCTRTMHPWPHSTDYQSK